MSYKVLSEASGSLTAGFVLKSIQKAGAIAVGSDIVESAGTYLADEFVLLPKTKDPALWEVTEKKIIAQQINIVIPTLDETLLAWSERIEYFQKKNIQVILSEKKTLEICQDKWNTFQFFNSVGIPCPKTSLDSEYRLIKPRLGRGSTGIFLKKENELVSMEGMISQEVITGQEYTVDVFCDFRNQPVYIIPRKRIGVKDGKSTAGITVKHPVIEEWIRTICSHLKFIGPINIQCFETEKGEIKFIEINPRLAGGMALGFAASENWIRLIFSNLIEKKEIEAVPIQYGLKMFRYYEEVFV